MAGINNRMAKSLLEHLLPWAFILTNVAMERPAAAHVGDRCGGRGLSHGACWPSGTERRRPPAAHEQGRGTGWRHIELGRGWPEGVRWRSRDQQWPETKEETTSMVFLTREKKES